MILFIFPTKSETLSFSYPTSITLDNGDLFIIHKNGIAITDPACTSIKKAFTLPEIITEEHYLKISIGKFEDGIIVWTIFDKFYYYSPTDNFVKRAQSTIVSNKVISYYSITPHYIDQSNNHYCIIAYISGDIYLYFKYYKFYPSSSSDINEIDYKYFEDFYYVDGIKQGRTNIKENNGLACEFLKNSYSENILTCFYTVYYEGYKLAISYFKIDAMSIVKESTLLNKHFNIGQSLDCIKSFTNTDHSKALICYYLYNSKSECFIYDLFDNINDINKNLFEYKGKCKKKCMD